MIKRLFIVVAGLALCVFILLFTGHLKTEAAENTIKVAVDTANIRSEPSNTASIIGKAHRHDQFDVQQQKFGWYEIKLSDDRKGWVAGYIVIQGDSQNNVTQKKGIVTVDHLHVRHRPSLSADIIGKLHTNDQVSITGKNNGWTSIVYRDQTAWVSSEYIQAPGNASKNKSSGEFVYISNDGTNLRADPSLSAQVITKGSTGERYPILGQEDDWYKIALASGREAYVASYVVSTNQATAPASKTVFAVNDTNRTPGLANKTIVLDAGHGGVDPGSVNGNGQLEKQLTLQTAKRLEQKLEAAGANVILTRSDDSYVPLSSRTAIANSGDKDVFVSIHYDSSNNREAHGFTTYYYHGHQAELASEVNHMLSDSLSLRNRGTRLGDYHVIRENAIPAVLLELGFLSNPNERAHITTDSYQEQAANSIYNGIKSYFK